MTTKSYALFYWMTNDSACSYDGDGYQDWDRTFILERKDGEGDDSIMDRGFALLKKNGLSDVLDNAPDLEEDDEEFTFWTCKDVDEDDETLFSLLLHKASKEEK